MKNQPLISVIILNHNGGDFLKKTLPIIFNQDYSNYEIIVVDNNSTDGSREFLKKQKGIKLIFNKSNLGSSLGRNIGVKKASGDFILFLDEDVLLPSKKFLQSMLAGYEPGAFISPVVIHKGREKTNFYGTFFSLAGPRFNQHRSFKEISKLSQNYPASCFHGACLFFKKSDWDNLGGFDENQIFYLDDFDLSVRCWIQGYRCLINPSLNVLHLGSGERKSNLAWCWKFQYFYSGYMRTIIKTYQKKNLIFSIPLFTIFTLLKTIKQSINRKTLCVFISFCKSIIIFIKNVKDTLLERKKIQRSRCCSDLFLNYRAPIIPEDV